MDFAGGSVVTDSPVSAQDRNLAPALGSGRSPGQGNCNPLQYSCLGNPMERGACWATVHGLSNYIAIITTITMTVNIEHLLYACVLGTLFSEVFQLLASPSHPFQLSCSFSYY